MNKFDLDTPCLVLDLDILEENLGKMQATSTAALTMLTTVISASHDTHVTVDAGLKALYRDGGQPQVATAKWRSLRYDWFGDEYGMLHVANKTAALPRIGKVIELVVSHCDPTVNQFDCYFLTRNNKVVDQWPIDLRGRSQ